MAATLRSQGHGTRYIADQIGVSRWAVRRWVDANEKTSYTEEGYPSPVVPHSVARQIHPKGWEPGIKWESNIGTVTWVDPDGEEPQNFEQVLAHFGFSPDNYQIIGELDARTWTMQTQHGLHTARYFKAKVIPKAFDTSGLDELVDLARQTPPKLIHRDIAHGALVVNLADWQVGKRDGDGTRGIIERAKALPAIVAERIRYLESTGRVIDSIIIAGLGDLFEGCDGFYPQQTYTVEVNRRQQGNIIRHLLFDIIKEVAQLDRKVIVVAVGGNHGENRKNGKSFTDFGDNDDLFVFDQLAHVFTEAEYENVSFVIPREELSVTLDVAGKVITWAHGHQFRGSGSSSDKAFQWLKGQALSRRPAGDCDILIYGHYHYYLTMYKAGRWFIQCPSLESESTWYAHTYGDAPEPGTLTFFVNGTGPSDFQVV